MKTGLEAWKAAKMAGSGAAVALALCMASWAQTTPQQTPSPTPAAQQQPANSQQPASAQQPANAQQPATPNAHKPAPGTTPVAGDVPPPPPKEKSKHEDKRDKKDKKDAKNDENVNVDPEKVVGVGSDLQKVQKGSIADVNAVGNRDIGGRGLGNWYSTDSEIKMGKMYADQIDKSTKFIPDPVIT